MSRIHNSAALPYSCGQRMEIDYQADLWVVPWSKLGYDYCGVYVITPAAKWPIKIGISEDAAVRLNQLQTAHWHQLRIDQYWICENKKAARIIEARAHSEFKSRRLMGEWFDLRGDKAAEIIEFVGEMAGIELVRQIPETARFEAVKNYIENFYEARALHLDKLGKL